jgi:hypothetical protein
MWMFKAQVKNFHPYLQLRPFWRGEIFASKYGMSIFDEYSVKPRDGNTVSVPMKRNARAVLGIKEGVC